MKTEAGRRWAVKWAALRYLYTSVSNKDTAKKPACRKAVSLVRFFR